MKLVEVEIENLLSFGGSTSVKFDQGMNLLTGPNGGGKSNLMEIIFTAMQGLMPGWSIFNRDPQPFSREFREIAPRQLLTLSTYKNAEVGRRVRLTIQADSSDAANFEALREFAPRFGELRERLKIEGGPELQMQGLWTENPIRDGNRYIFELTGFAEADLSDDSRVFRQYLRDFNRYRGALALMGAQQTMSLPLLLLPINRASDVPQTGISLTDVQEHGLATPLVQASTKGGSGAFTLALYRLASVRHELVLRFGEERAKVEFKQHPDVVALSTALDAAGFSWDIDFRDKRRNGYDVVLSKDGVTYSASNASAGERELLNLMFVAYTLGLGNGCLLIDEPEQHLHPQWQRLMIATLMDLAKCRGLQVIAATHAAAMITPKSIHSVRRVYLTDTGSAVTPSINLTNMQAKDLLQIVQSQNNERVFFSDLVILVEGPSDRIVFEKLVSLAEGKVRGKTVDVVDVGGKHNFSKYENLLRAALVNFVVIADLDYARQIGDERIKALFATDEGKLTSSVLNGASRDGRAILEALDSCANGIANENTKALAEHLRTRYASLRPRLGFCDRRLLTIWRRAKASEEGVFLLPKGTIEEHLPKNRGFKDKDLGKLVAWLASDESSTYLESERSLTSIRSQILGRLAPRKPVVLQ